MAKQIAPITAEKFFNRGKERWMMRFAEEDFHNDFYIKLEEINSRGIFCENGRMKKWWGEIEPCLRSWGALRPEHKLDQTKIKSPGFWKGFKDTATQLRKDLGGHDIASDKAKWELCEDLFDKAHEIKPVKSPTLPAKLCHFIFPALFPVSDLKLVGINDAKEYPDYWRYVRGCWLRTKATDKRGLEDNLRAGIKRRSKGKRVFGGYPFACKIGEFHVIGQCGWDDVPNVGEV